MSSFSHMAGGETWRFDSLKEVMAKASPARSGDWIEARINIRKSSAALIFADAILVSGKHELMRVGGLFRPFEKKS